MAKKVTTYQFSRQFKREYNKLPKEIQKAFDEKLSLFLKQTSHPSLRVKRIQGTKNRWEGSITMKYRFTFEPQKRAHSPLLAAGLASESKNSKLPYGRRFPAACGGELQFLENGLIFRAIGTHDILNRESQ